jgi:hypothetical protein
VDTVDLDYEAPNGALTSALIRTILESRRALRMAIALTQDLMREGAVLQWEEDEQLELAPIVSAGRRHWDGSDHSRAQAFHASKRRDVKNSGLRLVVPDRHESPLVMPAGSPFTSAKKATHEHGHDRRELDATEGKSARDLGKADG